MFKIALLSLLVPVFCDILKLSNERVSPGQLKQKYRFVFGDGPGNHVSISCNNLFYSQLFRHNFHIFFI